MSPIHDAATALLDGSITLGPTTDTPATSTTRDSTSGALIVDLLAGGSGTSTSDMDSVTYAGVGVGGTGTRRKGGVGSRRLVATLVLPAAPSTYDDTLTSYIEQSDFASSDDDQWERIASFPVLYAFTRELTVLATTAFVAADIGQTLTGGTTGDTGTIRWFHPNLLATSAAGLIIVTMDAANDLFDDISETVSSGGTGVGTMQAAGVVPTEQRASLSGPGTFHRSFTATKRYIRANLTVSAGGSFGSVQLLLGAAPFTRGY